MINHAKTSILFTFFFCMGQGQTHISYASINKIRELLSKYHDVNIKRSWLFECIRFLIDSGYISRKPRYEQRTGGMITQRPSMVSFTKKGIDWLLVKGVSRARVLLENMLNYFKREDGRFPTEKEFTSKLMYPSDPIEASRLKQLAAISTKEIT